MVDLGLPLAGDKTTQLMACCADDSTPAAGGDLLYQAVTEQAENEELIRGGRSMTVHCATPARSTVPSRS
jgi:hypothetical protein